MFKVVNVERKNLVSSYAFTLFPAYTTVLSNVVGSSSLQLKKFWNTPTKYGPLICSNLLFEHKFFLWPWRYHLIVLLLSVFHLQKGNIFLSRGECWNVAFSASGTIQIKWNKDWLWRQGLIWLYEDHHMMIWWSSYDFTLMTGGCSNDMCSGNIWL